MSKRYCQALHARGVILMDNKCANLFFAEPVQVMDRDGEESTTLSTQQWIERSEEEQFPANITETEAGQVTTQVQLPG